jgi:hypothetical protein
MNQYIITGEDIHCLFDYFQAALDGEENKETLKRLFDQQCGVIRSNIYTSQSGQCPHWMIGRVVGVDGDTNEYFCNANPQAERDTVLDEKLASRYKAILVHCMDTIKDIRRKYTIAPKTCRRCSSYDLCEELHRQESKEEQG